MKLLRINYHTYTMVDDEDFEWLSPLKGWALTKPGYAVLHKTKKGKATNKLLSRMIMFAEEGTIIDHKDGNRLNNQKANLRFCTVQQNVQNSRKRKRYLYSRYKGVKRLVNKKSGKIYWHTKINYTGKETHIGAFPTEHLAALAYDLWAISIHKEFAKTNFKNIN